MTTITLVNEFYVLFGDRFIVPTSVVEQFNIRALSYEGLTIIHLN